MDKSQKYPHDISQYVLPSTTLSCKSGQGIQEVDPIDEEYVPILHEVQTVAPSLLLYFPDSHKKHLSGLVAPKREENFPFAQNQHS
jgi:hypothetical protein